MLTLKEYLSQETPVKMPMVKLAHSEYKVVDSYIFQPGTQDEQQRVIIRINHYPEYRYGVNALLVKSGVYIYNVTSEPHIYHNLAH